MGNINIEGVGDYASLNEAIAAASPGQQINITGTWASDGSERDNVNVTWNKAVNVVCDAQSRSIGRPWQTGDTHYQLIGDGAGHVITASADVDIDGMDLQSQSVTVSDECIRVESQIDIVLRRCILGFVSVVSQQDIIFTNNVRNFANKITLDNAIFYNAGRCGVFSYLASGTLNFDLINCSSYHLGSVEVNQNGAFLGLGKHGVSDFTVTCNVHGGLLHTDSRGGQNHIFGVQSGTTATLNIDELIISLAENRLQSNWTTTLGNVQYSVPWVEGNPALGQVGVLSLVSPYDLRLFDDDDNVAKDAHTVATGPISGLPMSATDIVGTSRPQPWSGAYDMGAYEIVQAGGEPTAARALLRRRFFEA